ncbi:MAG: hypothetical protein GY884_24385, partial [Proteobacteria bacterium]|nr:hypothetical protein [Pseudomonadota bacterium]
GSTIRFDEDSDIVLRVGSYSEVRGPDQTYVLGVQLLAPNAIGALPANVAGVIDDEPFQPWYAFQVESGKTYEVRADSPSGSFAPRLRVIDGITLSFVDSASDGRARFEATADTTLFVQVYESNKRGDSTFDYTLEVAEFIPTMLPLDTPTSGQLASGDREVFYRVTTTNPGEFEVVVDTVGGWPAAIQLLRADAFINMSRDQVSNRLTYATSRYSDIIVVVRSQLPALSGPLDFDITVGHRDLAAPPVETEPNDASQPELVGALPAMRGGTLEDGPDNEDVFAIEVTRGQRIWALASSDGGTSVFGFDVELELIRSDASVAIRSTFGGEGFYPAIY